MVKGISRRVVMVDSPDPHIFEQAIFIVRNDAFNRDGITPEQVVSEACRVAKGYTASHDRAASRRLTLSPLCYTALGGGVTGLLWLLVSIL